MNCATRLTDPIENFASSMRDTRSPLTSSLQPPAPNNPALHVAQLPHLLTHLSLSISRDLRCPNQLLEVLFFFLPTAPAGTKSHMGITARPPCGDDMQPIHRDVKPLCSTT